MDNTQSSLAASDNDVSVHMIREPLRPFPMVDLPAGYRFRTYHSGDEATWTAIQRRQPLSSRIRL
jgi:hypothetical protein